MRKQVIRAAVIGTILALAVTASAVGSKPKLVRVGNLFLRDNGGITPTKLPRNKQAPVTAYINGLIGTADGTHPPAIESVVADFDRTIQVHAEGLPSCKLAQLVARGTADVRKACPDAIVGEGKAEVEVAFPEQSLIEAKGPILIFNGGVQNGTTRLFIHTYVNVPAPTAVVATVELSRINRGHYGMHAEAQIPKIAGGAGSVTKYKFTINREFTYKGKQQSFLTASCPTGVYYAEGQVRFSDDTLLKVTHAFPCTPRD
jgi:hypothetical protein